MKLYLRSKLQSTPLVELRRLWVLHECPLGTVAVISCCCQSRRTPLPDR